MNFLNTLAWWQWVILAAVPPAIISLYFLKLKRQPLEVPSTYLWSRTIEDLHVNSIWQRLRQSLLLLLQLLLVGLLMFALARPGWRGTRLVGKRFIFLIDNSASMNATDVGPNRLEDAKQQVKSLIEQMKTDDVAMLISVSDIARVEQPYTSDRSLLRSKVEGIQSTSRGSDIEEALRYAAGLANPGRSATEDQDIPVAEERPARLYIFSDGGFQAIPSFFLGNLTPEYIPLGVPAPRNVGIVAFAAEEGGESSDRLRAFARLENFGTAAVTDLGVNLMLNGQLVDRKIVSAIEAGETAGVDFILAGVEQGELRLELEIEDDLVLDNSAYAALNPPSPAKVLLVTPENEALQLVLSTDQAARLAEVSYAAPDVLTKKVYQDQASAGGFDLIIYDRCQPETMPQANTLFLGALPPGDWERSELQGPPLIIDSDRVHPLMQLIEMGNVKIVEGFAVKPPPGGRVLMDADIGPLIAIAPRQGMEDVVVGFPVTVVNEQGKTEVNTDWPIRRSFPVFFMNVLKYLGRGQAGAQAPSVRPGEPLTISAITPVEEIRITAPGASQANRVLREGANAFVYAGTEEPGVYEVREGSSRDVAQRFAVNLFDTRESNIRPEPTIEFPHETVAGQIGSEATRFEAWKWVLLAGLAVLLFEWYVYNRRVYY